MTVQELITSWGFDVDTEPLRGLQNEIKTVKGYLGDAVKAIAAAEAALAALVYTTIQEQRAFQTLAYDTGIAVEKLQAHARAAQLAGVPLESYNAAITSLAANLNELAINPMSDASVKMRFMGIQTHDSAGKIRDATDVLEDFGTRLDKITDSHKRAAYATAILGSGAGALMPFLTRGKEGMAALVQEARQLGLILSDQDHKAILKTGELINWFKMAAIGLKNQLVTGMNPAIMETAKSFKKWYIENQAFLKSGLVEGLKTLVWILEGTAIAIATAVSVGKELVDMFGGWERTAAIAKIAILLVSTAIGVKLTMAAIAAAPALYALAASWIAAAAPAIALAAVIVAVGLALDDVYTYATGGDSAIGALIETMKEAGGIAEAVGEVLEFVFGGGIGNTLYDMGEAFSEFFSALPGAAIAAAGTIQESFSGIWTAIKRFFGAIPEAAAKAWASLKEGLMSIPTAFANAFAAAWDAIGPIGQALFKGIGSIGGAFGKAGGTIIDAIKPSTSPQAAPLITPMATPRPGAYTPATEARAAGNRILNQGGNVTLHLKSETKIEGVSDPEEAATLAGAALDKSIQGHLSKLQRTAGDAATGPSRY